MSTTKNDDITLGDMADETPERHNELEDVREGVAELPKAVPVGPTGPGGRIAGPPPSGMDFTALAATATASAVVFREVVKQIGETKRERLRQDGATARALLRGPSADDGANPDDKAEQDEADT